MVNQFHALGSARTHPKSVSNGNYYHHHHHHGSLPYVGFPGLTLTPIPENSLLQDSVHQHDDALTSSRPWLKEDSATTLTTSTISSWNSQTMKQGGSLPNHWITSPVDHHAYKGVHYAKVPSTAAKMSSKTCYVDMSSSSGCCLPKEDEVDGSLAVDRKRSYLAKLFLLGLCGVLIVAGIVLWVFSPAFT